MDSFLNKDSLTAVEWVLRAVVAYLFMLIVVKTMGQRSISQLRLPDFVIALIIGDIIAHPLSNEKISMKGTMITVSVLAILYSASIFASLKLKMLRKLIEPTPMPLIESGQILFNNLKKAKISLDYLLSEARKEKIDDLKKISIALWEPDGTISFFLDQQHQNVTKADMRIAVKAYSLPKTVIKDGKIDIKTLTELGKDEHWLKSNIQSTYHAVPSDILLATLDSNDQLSVFFYK